MKITTEKFYVSLKVLIRNNNNDFLVLRSLSSSKFFSGKYDLPGGRIDNVEINTDFHKILKREVKEECGNIKFELRSDPVSIAKFSFSQDMSIFFILFLGKYISGTVKISDEHESFAWLKLNKQNINKHFHSSLKQLLTNYLKWN